MRAQLIVKYSSLDGREYEQLYALRESYSWGAELRLETTRTRLYPPLNLIEKRRREVDQERENGTQE